MTMTRIAGAARGPRVQFVVDGQAVTGHADESVAAACAAAGVTTLRHGPGDGGPRGAFCFMGACQECVVLCAGLRTEACRLPVSDGLTIQRL